jgi:uncharacterized protein (DUF305 family)
VARRRGAGGRLRSPQPPPRHAHPHQCRPDRRPVHAAHGAHLWQTTSIAFLTRDRITHPALARLAGAINQRGQANIQQLQAWLFRRGLAPHGHSHQRADNRQETDLERLSRLRGTAFDLAFLEVMTARTRAGINLATVEASQGALPEVRQRRRGTAPPADDLLPHRQPGPFCVNCATAA